MAKKTSATPKTTTTPKAEKPKTDWAKVEECQGILATARDAITGQGLKGASKRLDSLIKELGRAHKHHIDVNQKKTDREEARKAEKAEKLRKELAKLEGGAK